MVDFISNAELIKISKKGDETFPAGGGHPPKITTPNRKRGNKEGGKKSLIEEERNPEKRSVAATNRQR